MSFCTNCGARLEQDARFCASCGTEVVPVSAAPAAHSTAPTAASTPTTAPSGQPVEHTPLPNNPSTAAGFASSPTATQQRPAANPFSSIPRSDFIRDGLAVFLLFIALFMTWRYGSGSTTGFEPVAAGARVEVILPILLSILSCGVTYLWRAGVFGVAWNYSKTRLVRLVANLPLMIVIVVYLIIEMVTRDGLGPAVAFSMAGVALAAQPRKAEYANAAQDAAVDKAWFSATVVLGGVFALLTFIKIVIMLTTSGALEVLSVLITLVVVLTSLAVPALALVGVLRRDNEWRLVAMGVGAAGLLLILLGLVPEMTLVNTRFTANPAFDLTFWGAIGALAAAPSVKRAMMNTSLDAKSLIGSVRRTLDLTIVLCASIVLLTLLSVILVASLSDALGGITASNQVPTVVVLFLAILLTVGAFVARTHLVKNSAQMHMVVSGLALALLIIGIVFVVMLSNGSVFGFGESALLLAFAVPTALAALMWLPKSVRARASTGAGTPAFGSGFSFYGNPEAQHAPTQHPTAPANAHASAQAVVTEAPAGQTPVTQGPATQAQPTQETHLANSSVLQEAVASQDPNRLYEIAATVPEARPLIAQNPAAYPGLLEWLAQLGDPRVDEALRNRRG